MSLRYDLHSHSTASDGTLAPSDLVDRAARCGIDVLALTDHDCTDGLAEAELAASKPDSVQLVPGVEISVTWKKRLVHIIGLAINQCCPVLQAGLNMLQRKRNERARDMARKLERLGVSEALHGAARHAHGKIVSRSHFARMLVEQGRASNFRDAFSRFLRPDCPGFVDCQWATLSDAVGWITAAGGIAVVAHPARYDMRPKKLRTLLGEFRECGGVGIEVVGSGYKASVGENMAQYARTFGLLASIGSDFHDPGNVYPQLGRLPALPPGCTPIWEVMNLTRHETDPDCSGIMSAPLRGEPGR